MCDSTCAYKIDLVQYYEQRLAILANVRNMFKVMNIGEQLPHKITAKNCMRNKKCMVCIFIFFVATQLLYWNNARVEYSPLVIFESWGLQKNEPHFPKVHHLESISAKVQSISLLWEPDYDPISWSAIHFVSLEQRTLFGRSALEKQVLEEISSNYENLGFEDVSRP